MMFPIKYNGDILSHNARVGVDGGIVESLDFVNDFSEQTKRVNIPTIVTSGLVLYLDAGQTASYPGIGTVWTDLSGNGNNGTLVNGPTFNSANGGSIVFDGTDYVVVNTLPSLQNTDKFTLFGWFKRRISTSKIICGVANAPDLDVTFELWSDGNVYFEVGNGSNSYAYTTNNTVNWQFITMVFNGQLLGNTNRLKGYVNGVLQSLTYNTSVPNITGNLTNPFYIGGNILGSYSDGNISQFLIYNRALSDAEVLQNYNATKSRFGL